MTEHKSAADVAALAITFTNSVIMDKAGGMPVDEIQNNIKNMLSEVIQAETKTLAAEALALRVENERVREMLGKTTRHLPQCKNKLDAAFGGDPEDQITFPEVNKFLLQPTPTGISDEILRLAAAGYGLGKKIEEEAEKGYWIEPSEDVLGPLDKGIEALSPETIKLLEGVKDA